MAIEPNDLRVRMGFGVYDFVISDSEEQHFAINETLGPQAVRFLSQVAISGTRHYFEASREFNDERHDISAFIAPWDTSVDRDQVHHSIPEHDKSITRINITEERRPDSLLTAHDFFIATDRPFVIWRRQTTPLVKNDAHGEWPCSRNDIPKVIRNNQKNENSAHINIHTGVEYEKRRGHRSQAPLLESARELAGFMQLFTASNRMPICEVKYYPHNNKAR